MRLEALFVVLAVPAIALACESTGGLGSEDRLGRMGPPGADMPAFCEEVSRARVVDLAVAPEGFAFPAIDAVQALTGAFSGELITSDAEGNEGPPAAASLTLAAESVDAVQLRRVDWNQDSTREGPPIGAAEDPTLCDPRYEIRATLHFAAGAGLLDEALTVDVIVFEATSGRFAATLAAGDVRGTAEPSGIAAADWDRIDFVMDAFAEAGTWRGSLMWSAVNEDPVQTMTYDSITGIGSGTVEVSGMTTMLGTFTVPRAATP